MTKQPRTILVEVVSGSVFPGTPVFHEGKQVGVVTGEVPVVAEIEVGSLAVPEELLARAELRPREVRRFAIVALDEGKKGGASGLVVVR